MEAWKPVLGFEGLYEISDIGRCRNPRTMLVLKRRYLRGYVRYTLYNLHGAFCRQAHRLTWEAFRGPIDRHLEINHMNGIRDDNRLENLEVVTHDENMAHRAAVLKPSGVRGSASNLAKLHENDVLEIYALLMAGFSHSNIAARYDVSRPTVSMISTGKTWPHLFSRYQASGSALK